MNSRDLSSLVSGVMLGKWMRSGGELIGDALALLRIPILIAVVVGTPPLLIWVLLEKTWQSELWFLAAVPLLALIPLARALWAQKWWRAGAMLILMIVLATATSFAGFMERELKVEADARTRFVAQWLGSAPAHQKDMWPGDFRRWADRVGVTRVPGVHPATPPGGAVWVRETHRGVYTLRVADAAALTEHQAMAARHGNWVGFASSCRYDYAQTEVPKCSNPVAAQDKFGIDLMAIGPRLMALDGAATCDASPRCREFSRKSGLAF